MKLARGAFIMRRLSGTAREHKDISHIVKVASNCNTVRQHCHYLHDRSWTPVNRMARDVLRHTIHSLLAYNTDYANFVWHGGEPLVMGRDFYQDIVDIQRRRIQEHDSQIALSNCIQANGVLLDGGRIDFFIANDFNVSISLDDFFDLHARNRGTNREAFDVIMANVTALSERGVPFTVLCVVANDTLGQEEELFDFFAD